MTLSRTLGASNTESDKTIVVPYFELAVYAHALPVYNIMHEYM